MKWKKLGRIFNPMDYDDGIKRDWMWGFAQCPSTLILNDAVRIFFSSRSKKDDEGQYNSYTSYLDVNKNDLTEIIRVSKYPVMELGDIGSFDENAIYPTSVVNTDGLTYMYYAGWKRCKSVPFDTAIGLGISDCGGGYFSKYSPGPILSASESEPFVISGPKVRIFNKKWYMYYIAGTEWIKTEDKPEITYDIRMAVSDDGLKWNKLNKKIIPNILGYNECQAGPDVFFKDGYYHMYFVYRHALDFRENKDRGYKIGYAYSNDLVNWIRDDSQAGIEYSEEGWDSTMQHYPHVFELNNNWYMLYNGNDFGKEGIGLAILEK